MRIGLFKKAKKEIVVYFFILALTALGLGLSDGIFSNYFKEAYNVNAFQRGLIEFPRELPGILSTVVISLLSFIGDIRISIIAQLLSCIGLLLLGFLTPPFAVMCIFLFVNSMGMHLFFPLSDGIGMSLIKGEEVGKRMGQYKGVSTAFSMFASILVFVGFRTGIFSLTSPVKITFVIGALIFAVVFILFIYMNKIVKIPIKQDRKLKFVFRREYKYYYILAIMTGVQKQIMAVYGPWVLIDLLSKRADTIAILGIIGSFIGIFFIPALGRWLDRYGIRKMLYADALSFIVVYIAYGFLASGFSSGILSKVGIPVILTFVLIILDRMSMQMSMIKTIYLRSIAVDKSEITPTLSFGMSMDHIVSIVCAYIGGIIWTAFGPQYIFFFAAVASFVNLAVAKLAVINEDKGLKPRVKVQAVVNEEM
ncbi:MFS transporter [Clostridium swellfunianum]|uniref:MFS transporter n=1 Tax=Clostridium swellfunianum TaxID=1367462 RepID=UPI00202E2BDD|nr:MFS transporter [Clostridium swellfunianum]MCM0647565.1 MFS transporter [Clostridium swellfunianum]